MTKQQKQQLLRIWVVFWYAHWPYIFFWGRNVYSSPLPTFNWTVWLFVVKLLSSLYILDSRYFSDKWFTNIFSYSMDCLFTSLLILLCTHSLNFDEVQIYYLFFLLLMILVLYLRNHFRYSHKDLPLILCTHSLNFDEVQIFYLFFLLLMLLVLYLRNHCQIQNHKDLPLCFLLRLYDFSLYNYVFNPY